MSAIILITACYVGDKHSPLPSYTAVTYSQRRTGTVCILGLTNISTGQAHSLTELA